MRYSLDTNILVYAVDRTAGRKRELALEIMRRARTTECVLTLQSLGEMFRVLTARRHLPPTEAAEWVRDWREVADLAVADEACLAEAMAAVREHRWSFWDAMIWATARKAGCRLLLTEDGQADRELGGVTLVNPFLPNPSPLLVEALGPLA